MGRNYGEKSILKTKVIKNVLLNEKDYTFQDFKFKVIKAQPNPNGWISDRNYIEVYNYDVLILKIQYQILNGLCMIGGKLKDATKLPPDKKFDFSVIHFNGQTNNDCQSINHIIGTFSELCTEQHEDRGNASLINNQYIFRRKDNFYSYTKVWMRGDIEGNNYNQDLSHEFATEEYINHIKKIFGFKRMPRRDLKNQIKTAINKAVSTESKRKLVETLEEPDGNKRRRF